MARYHIEHRTVFTYQYPVTISHHTARLQPLADDRQTLESFRLLIRPEASEMSQCMDYFGNAMQLFSIEETHDKLEVVSRSTVDVHVEPAHLGAITTTYEDLRIALTDLKRRDLLEARQHLYPTDATPAIDEARAFGLRFLEDEKPLGASIAEMLDAFHSEFEFDPTATDISTPIAEVFASNRGVCQDFAHLMIASLRACGLSARYVSGYILTNPPPDEDRLVGADASHAWVSIFAPETGWFEVDPTNRLVCGDQHIRVAYGRDFSDGGMLSGAVTGGGDHSVEVEVTVEPT